MTTAEQVGHPLFVPVLRGSRGSHRKHSVPGKGRAPTLFTSTDGASNLGFFNQASCPVGSCV